MSLRETKEQAAIYVQSAIMPVMCMNNMTLESQVVSLELAKRLKELGVKQESFFWWRSPLAHYGYPDWSLSDGELGHGSESYSAFTVAELISELQRVAKRDILIASDNANVADWLAEELIKVYAQNSEIQG